MFLVRPMRKYLHSMSSPSRPNPYSPDIRTGRQWKRSPHWTRRGLVWSPTHRSSTEQIYLSGQIFDLAIIQLSIPMVFSMVLPSTHPKWCQHLIPVKSLNLAPWGPCAASCSRRLCDKAVPPSHASCKYHWSTLIKSYILRKYLWIIFIEYRPVPVVVLPASMVPVGELWSGFSYLEVQPVSIFWFGQE